MIIAIDGPAGAGKSTIALRVADELSARLISTGALYRALALMAHRRGIPREDEATLVSLADGLDVDFKVVDGVNRVYVHGEDETEALRTARVSEDASFVSAFPGVREALVDVQRSYICRGDIVMEGRDIGTVIFPGAELKVFLTASAEERARRRVLDYERAGTPRAFDEVLEEIQLRDHRDETREAAPLRAADDAILVDATELGIQDVVARVVSLALEKKR